MFLAAGFFDGLHRGHQRVIAQTVARARAAGGEAWILTFDAHPLKILAPAAAPRLLTSNRHKLKLIESLGVDGCLLLPFTRALAGLEPALFVGRLRRQIPSLAEIFVGTNWRFGRHASGRPALLARLGRDLDFAVTVVPPVFHQGHPVSSSRIRRHILLGQFSQASALLGRPCSVLGTVIHGRGVGRKLGYPTANLDLHNEVLPPNGVYAVTARIHAGHRRAAIDAAGIASLGVRPTFRNTPPGATVLEIHLLDMRPVLYGRDVEVFFRRKIRRERAFRSAEELRRQIPLDILRARRILG